MFSTLQYKPLTRFQVDVRAGLLAHPKTLPSKYFYGGRGDELFAQIMTLPEYYLTRCEADILERYSSQILNRTGYVRGKFEMLELGAGNGLKTRILLEAGEREKLEFVYRPVDISPASLTTAQANILATVPTCQVIPHVADYTNLDSLPYTDYPRLWLFLGSNLGNCDLVEAVYFLQRLARRMQPQDTLLLGLDLHKETEIILPAYNDSAGVTAEFNLNLLRRINYECETNFDLTHFVHAPVYNTRLHRAESYLRSLSTQRVCSELLNIDIEFGEGERIHTEISQKYTSQSIAWLLRHAGLVWRAEYTDSRGYYTNVLCAKP